AEHRTAEMEHSRNREPTKHEEKVIVRKPVIETADREETRIVFKPVYETVEQEQHVTVNRPVTQQATQTYYVTQYTPYTTYQPVYLGLFGGWTQMPTTAYMPQTVAQQVPVQTVHYVPETDVLTAPVT